MPSRRFLKSGHREWINDAVEIRGFDAAMAGCRIVFHVASPFNFPEKIKDGQCDMIEPALQGTRNVLGGVDRTESVRRVMMTSRIGAICGGDIDVCIMKDGTVAKEVGSDSRQETKGKCVGRVKQDLNGPWEWPEMTLFCPRFPLLSRPSSIFWT